MRRSYGEGETVQRDAHAKTHGLVKAKFKVVDDLPDELRYGVFAEPKSFDAVIRFSASSQLAQPDTEAQPHGMAIKLLGVEGKKLLKGMEDAKTQDFVMINFPTFFVADLETYIETERVVSAASAGKTADLEGELKVFAKKNPQAVTIAEKMAANPFNNPFEAQYWSQTPYRLGPNAIKFSAKPITGSSNKKPKGELGPLYLREAMIDTISNKTVKFEFLVQVQKDPDKQPIEDPTVEWKESDTKPIRVAIIEIPVQDISSDKNLMVAEQLSFAAWHSLPEHRPLGSMNRARRVVYEGGTILRHKMNKMERSEPTTMPSW
ncbi:catalase family protein [Kangiella sp. TOML190]|uniref:catalase family protein n=1 Tax=Kangiella sp. TOML190 TaxID=2931351 RepID=UPI00203E44E7|nr:catalase family protein [Kangiella sp. TOML190]